MKNTLALFIGFILTMVLLSFIQKKKTFNYLPLGDSYTIGTGASGKESWPLLLTDDLNEKNININLLGNPARNGYSTQDLIDNELPQVRKLKPDFITLLIGVNDWVRQVPISTFSKNLVTILDEVQNNLLLQKNIILITIPDFGVTPQGKNYSAGRDISKGIAAFNDVIKREASKRGLSVVDIFEVSKQMGKDPGLVAADGLHPSAKEYALWEKMILKSAAELLQ